ncbi:carboxymuconolactone decarboxylase family protein [Amniculibacterium aquaticum]|uniref:carboxymuconolactone decarboxylase family protein n=1 Tax=Amniculibacterium aquaticum TaxID=2479858 RepID=UPI000F599186|nr:carboxymuconolactone decarboxylase family protein [Amniculibacterium aquaticum]
MNQYRKSINEMDPSAFKAMLALENWGKSCDLDPKLKELIKIRASQINGCAYCLDMHTEDALDLGESSRRIFAVSVWHESHLFSEEERTLLQYTEEVTNIAQEGVQDETHRKMLQFFGEKMTAQILMLVVTINAWNRIAVATKLIYKD